MLFPKGVGCPANRSAACEQGEAGAAHSQSPAVRAAPLLPPGEHSGAVLTLWTEHSALL